MRNFVIALLIGLSAYWLAIGIGIPSWRDWEPGDAADIGLCIGLATWLIMMEVSRHG